MKKGFFTENSINQVGSNLIGAKKLEFINTNESSSTKVVDHQSTSKASSSASSPENHTNHNHHNHHNNKPNILLKLEHWERQPPNKVNMELRLNEATQRREESISSIATKARTHYTSVLNTVHRNNIRHNQEVKDLATQLTKKGTVVEDNKDMIRKVHSTKMQQKMDKIYQVKQRSMDTQEDIKQRTMKKMEVVMENKENIQRGHLLKLQQKMEKIHHVKVMESMNKAKMQEQSEEKMALVTEKKETLVAQQLTKIQLQNQEKIDKIAHVKEMDQLAKAEIEEKMQMKMALIEVKKENDRHEYSTKMQEKMEKISRVRDMDLATKAEIEEKTQKKMNEAAERKSKLLSDNRAKVLDSLKKKRKRVESNREADAFKVEQLRLLSNSKLTSANERKMEALSSLSNCTASSTKKGLERARLYKLAQDADLSSLCKKLEDKMFVASQKKEDVLNTITSKAAKENKVRSERTQEALKKRQTDMMEIQCKHENKLVSATKRKQRLGEQELDKKEMTNLHREKVLESTTFKNNVLLPKAKEQLESKLEEAANRRSMFLMQKKPQSSCSTPPTTTTGVTLSSSTQSPPSLIIPSDCFSISPKCLSRPAEEEVTMSQEEEKEMPNDALNCQKTANAIGAITNSLVEFIMNIPKFLLLSLGRRTFHDE